MGSRRKIGSIRAQVDQERDVLLRVFRAAGDQSDRYAWLGEAVSLAKQWSGCEAAGIRLRGDNGSSCFEQQGFARQSVQREHFLWVDVRESAVPAECAAGPGRGCLCGDVLCRRVDSRLSCITERGSFWTNALGQFLASPQGEGCRRRLRPECLEDGYQSLALIPLRNNGDTFGLLQLGDRRSGQFDLEKIGLLERLAESLGAILADRRATRQKFVEDTLPKSRQELLAVYDSLPVMMCILDADCRLLYANRAMEQYAENEGSWDGEPPGNVLACVNALNSPQGCGSGPQCETCPLRLAAMRTLQTGEKQWQVEAPLSVSRQGKVRDFVLLASFTLIRTADRTDLVVCFEDITQRRRAEKDLQESENKFRLLVESSPDAIGTVDAEGKIVFANPAVARSLGAERIDSLVGRSVFEFLPVEQHARFRESAEDILQTGIMPLREFTVRRVDGTPIEVEAQGVGLVEYGRPLMLFTIRDVTEKRQAEERLAAMEAQLRHAGRLATMGELVAGIAHEANQPICTIVNYAKACRNVLAQPDPDLDQLRQWSEAIALAASRTGEIVRRYRDFARRAPGVRRQTDVQTLIRESLLLVRFEAQQRRIELRTELPDPAAAVYGDPVQIQQVLVNLLLNAMEAFDTGRVEERLVLVSAVPEGSWMRISVQDNASGAAADKPAKWFEPFFTTKPEGLGIGLAISRTIVESHGGRIWAEHNRDGGMTFCFTLPATSVEASHAVP